MIFEQSRGTGLFGKVLGFLFSYFLFTTILYFILTLLKKIPETWFYLHVMVITAAIVVLGIFIKRLLK